MQTASNSSINLTILDFDLYRNSLVAYLQAQPIFQGFDFTGSNIQPFLNTLARNTFHNGFFLNFVGTEMWLGSCQLRDSAVSHAKELNYLPRSFRSAKATIDLTVTSNDATLSFLTIPLGTSFTSKVGSNNYTFVTEENIVLAANNGVFNAANLEIFEGSYTQDTFVMNYSNSDQRFILSNPTIDTTTLIVSVSENSSANDIVYTQANSLFGLAGNSQVYFLQACENNQYEIIWGDNVLGRKPLDQAVITTQYVICNGELPNGANNFSPDGLIDGQSNVTITVINAAGGGAVNEDINSIKFNAPRHYTTAERAVPVDDYEILLKENFPEIEAIAAYGGEDLVPPQYGKVFISLIISGLSGIPQSKIVEYTNFLNIRNSIGITPVIVPAQFTFVTVDMTANYNINHTDLTTAEMQTLLISSIMDFNATNLDDFKVTLYRSQFEQAVANADISIINLDTSFKIMNKLNPTLGVASDFMVVFGTALETPIPDSRSLYPITTHRTVTSSTFVLNNQNVMLNDDGNGNINIVRVLTDGVHVLKKTGTVDYSTGSISLFNFKVDQYFGDSLRIYGVTSIPDITAENNTVLAIANDEIKVTVNAVRVV